MPNRSIWTGKRYDSIQNVCDEKTVCRSAKSVKGQPLEAARTALENLSLLAYRVKAGEAAHGRRERRGRGVSEDCEWGRKFGIIEGVRE